MQTLPIKSLNHTLEETHAWLRELAGTEPFENEEQAYSGLRAVLHAIRDRLTVEEAAHLGSQLPMLVRGFYFEGWKPALAPNDESTAEEFLEHVRSSLGTGRQTQLDLDAATRAVGDLLERKLSEGQFRHVCVQLPDPIEALVAGAVHAEQA